MDILSGLLLLTVVHTLAAASPGPDFVFVSQQTLRHGKRTGLFTSLGIALGLSVHIAYSAFGLAAVIAHSADLLWWIRMIGGSYLIYLGSQGLRAKARGAQLVAENQGNQAARSPLGSIAAGFLCNALNPKAPIYFVSLFTLVLSPEMPAWQVVVYGIWIMCIQLLWFSFVVLVLSIPLINTRFQKAGHWIDRILGGAMIALGLRLLLLKSD